MSLQFTAYLASPLGFSEATRGFMNNVYVPILHSAGIATINPWDLTTDEEVNAVHSMPEGPEKVRAIAALNIEMGRRNKLGIDISNLVIANLDGQELDSGTAAEVGYAVGRGMPVYGWRSDFRRNGEHGAIVNLQVQYFIEQSGGRILRSLEELKTVLNAFQRLFKPKEEVRPLLMPEDPKT